MSLSTSPVLAASASNDLAQMRWLIERQSVPVDFMGDWYAEPRNGGKGLERQRRTPCMVAASHGSLEVLLYLLQMGADPNLRSEDEERCTAMHCAAAGGAALSTDAIKTLLLFGADRNARDVYGRVPADCLPSTTSDSNATSDNGGSSSGGSASTGGGRGQHGGNVAVNSQNGIMQELDEETLMSDEFRMYEFKIRRCSRTRAHDWTECPFTHPGEKARRRDPRRFNYCGTACPEFRKGSCLQGDVCEYAHGVFECWLHPSRYRTQLCKDGGACDRRACFFAHHTSQLRVPTDAFGNPLGNVSSNTPSPTGSGSPQNGSPRQSSASAEWLNARSSESDSTHSMAAMLKGQSMMGGSLPFTLNTAGSTSMAFPPLSRVDPMMLQSQFSQYGGDAQQQQRLNQQQYQQTLSNLNSLGNNVQGASGVDYNGNAQGFQMRYNSLVQPGNGLFGTSGDTSMQQARQLMQPNVGLMNGNHAQNGMNSIKPQSSGSAGSTGTSDLQPGAQPFTLPINERLYPQHMRRNSSSFQHLGMIEGVLDGDELAGNRGQ